MARLVVRRLRVLQRRASRIYASTRANIPSFPYRLLWEERTIRSVANLTRQDAHDFLALAAEIPSTTLVHEYTLTDANQALGDLRAGRLSGAAVLIP